PRRSWVASRHTVAEQKGLGTGGPSLRWSAAGHKPPARWSVKRWFGSLGRAEGRRRQRTRGTRVGTAAGASPRTHPAGQKVVSAERDGALHRKSLGEGALRQAKGAAVTGWGS